MSNSSGSDSRTEQPTGIYFAFPDGMLAYDCASCPAACCRGYGIGGSLQNEMKKLLDLYPALGNLATSRSGDLIWLANPASGCFFLDSDNLCRLEKEHTKDLKPGMCRLFPFNQLSKMGEWIVVAPSYFCPLSLADDSKPDQDIGRHARIEQTLSKTGLNRVPLPQVDLSSGDPDSTRREEIEFRNLCSAVNDGAAFTELIRQASADFRLLTQHLERASRLLQLSKLPEAGTGPDILDLTLRALAPTLRLSLLHLPAENRLLALAISERLIRRATSPLVAALTPGGTFNILTALGPALRLLARADNLLPAKGTTGPRLPDFGNRDMFLAACVVERCRERGQTTFSALETALASTGPTVDRTAFLVQLGKAFCA
jgi:Fe-S-cluster containining protein